MAVLVVESGDQFGGEGCEGGVEIFLGLGEEKSVSSRVAGGFGEGKQWKIRPSTRHRRLELCGRGPLLGLDWSRYSHTLAPGSLEATRRAFLDAIGDDLEERGFPREGGTSREEGRRGERVGEGKDETSAFLANDRRMRGMGSTRERKEPEVRI